MKSCTVTIQCNRLTISQIFSSYFFIFRQLLIGVDNLRIMAATIENIDLPTAAAATVAGPDDDRTMIGDDCADDCAEDDDCTGPAL